jgi:hypothetical protein
LAVVSEADAPRTVVLRMPAAKPANLHEYRYFEDDRPVDGHGFPRVSRVRLNADPDAGVAVHLPALGVVLMTTDDPPERSATAG